MPDSISSSISLQSLSEGDRLGSALSCSQRDCAREVTFGDSRGDVVVEPECMCKCCMCVLCVMKYKDSVVIFNVLYYLCVCLPKHLVPARVSLTR